MEGPSLFTWSGAQHPNNYVDLAVPQSKLTVLRKSSATIKTQIMHENLGASVEEDAKYGAYVGIVN